MQNIFIDGVLILDLGNRKWGGIGLGKWFVQRERKLKQNRIILSVEQQIINPFSSLGLNYLQTEVKKKKQKQVRTLGFEKRNKNMSFK